jgi:hypothetical protein
VRVFERRVRERVAGVDEEEKVKAAESVRRATSDMDGGYRVFE